MSMVVYTGGCQCGQIRYELHYVKPGTLDNTSWIKPVANQWTASAQPWITLSETMLNIARQATADELKEIYKRYQEAP